MMSLTLPPEASLHFCPISLSSVCQVEPLGASVPSLIFSSARADSGSTTDNASANRNERVFITPPNLVSEQITGAGQQPLGAPLRQDIDEPMRQIGVHVVREN